MNIILVDYEVGNQNGFVPCEACTWRAIAVLLPARGVVRPVIQVRPVKLPLDEAK